MNIHFVRSPFMCREGQFETGKRSLCVGIEVNALMLAKTYRCYIGENRKTSYEITFDKAMAIGHMWKNKKGKQVLIIPVSSFDVYQSNWNKDEYEKKEILRAQAIERRLF